MKNIKYSHGDFTMQDLSDHDPAGFEGDIIGSCFYQEKLIGANNSYISIFPNGMTGANFIGCNLTNVSVPVGNTYTQCVKYRAKEQNDREQWLVNSDGVPLAPIRDAAYDSKGISKDPADIPAELMDQSILM